MERPRIQIGKPDPMDFTECSADIEANLVIERFKTLEILLHSMAVSLSPLEVK